MGVKFYNFGPSVILKTTWLCTAVLNIQKVGTEIAPI